MAKLTVGMPAYNGEKFIADAIRCVLEQTYEDLVLVISDNASTDRTEEICRQFAAKDARVDYCRHEENLGATANYNFVAQRASTELFKWHSCNDLLSRNMLESCVQRLDRDPNIALVYAQTWLFENSVDDAQRYGEDPQADQDDALQRFIHVIDHMALNNIMNGVMRLDALKRTAMLREFYFADRTMMAELALRGKVIEDSTSRFYRRMDEDSATQKKSEEEVLKHFDPSWKRPLPFTNWRVYGSFLQGLWRSEIGLGSASSWSLKIARRAWWDKQGLATDIKEFFQYTLYDLKHRAQQ